ncbi:MAG TPA: FmdB family zinc ribbon protein [Thermoleophilia bacterium]|nr:FmdB family zinc ribbon protein [Thermoleophilia bacterium]
MPIYEYRCDDCGTSFEVLQRMSDDALETCDKCGGRLQKVLHPVAIHFKGSGFYTTDYGKGSGRRPGSRDGGSEGSSDGSSEASESAAASSAADSAKDKPADKSGSDGAKPKEKQKAT